MKLCLVSALLLCCMTAVYGTPASPKSWEMVDVPAVSGEKEVQFALRGKLKAMQERADALENATGTWIEKKNLSKKILEKDISKDVPITVGDMANKALYSEVVNRSVETEGDYKNKMVDDEHVPSVVDTSEDGMNHELVKSASMFGKAYAKSAHELDTPGEPGEHIAAAAAELAAPKLQERSSAHKAQARMNNTGNEIESVVGHKLKVKTKRAAKEFSWSDHFRDIRHRMRQVAFKLNDMKLSRLRLPSKLTKDYWTNWG